MQSANLPADKREETHNRAFRAQSWPGQPWFDLIVPSARIITEKQALCWLYQSLEAGCLLTLLGSLINNVG